MPEHPYCDSRGYFPLHRYVAEAHLGRLLEAKEVVHHINGDKENNLPSNLYLFPSSKEHASFHRQNTKFGATVNLPLLKSNII